MNGLAEFGPALLLPLLGLVGGIALFVRGLVAYRRDRQISSVATSTLDGSDPPPTSTRRRWLCPGRPVGADHALYRCPL